MQLADQRCPFPGLPQLDSRNAASYDTHPDQRGASRYLITAPAEIRNDSGKHVGLLRDLSASGVFVYSNFKPSCGEVVEIQIGIWNLSAEKVAITCRGKVVRVEQPASGAAIGIAISISGYQLHVANTEPQIEPKAGPSAA